MSDANRQLALRWLNEVWNGRNEATIDELLARHAVGHSDGSPDIHGPADFRAFRASLLDAFPDLELRIEDTVAEREHVIVRWRVSGTHRGSGLGFAASNKRVDFWGITWLRFVEGQLIEAWDAWNAGGLTQRLQAT